MQNGSHTVSEHRFRPQVNFNNSAPVTSVKFSGRARLEDHWREGQTGTG